ncbi:HAD-like domain-containing protein [Sphaerosporella brunnea]|uniref:HAD-like domain-containing protein n=1 Tax=Sphaerosporella brunnea TaxID=1250544 RepID=A0A5J5F8G6_9PEZI|nr:HAD-like domain-containing protein [Sphaerosporella brunnea]
MSFLTLAFRPCSRTIARKPFPSGVVAARQLHQTLPCARRNKPVEIPYENPLPPVPDRGEAPDYAFVFDIDGVLVHGSNPLPRAKETLEYLHDNHIPYMLLTNGGGYSEAAQVQQLNQRLRMRAFISEQQFVQSHTPFKEHASSPHLRTVLVLGGVKENVKEVAKGYGFRNVVIPADFLKSFQGVSPFTDKSHYSQFGTKLPKNLPKVDAVLVFNDPRDWALDIQVVVDVLLSEGGQVGTRRRVEDVIRDGHLPVYFSNPDLWWANEYQHARLGQRAFRAALEGVWRSITGGQELKATTIGKPHQPTYEFAEDTLTRWRARKLKQLGAFMDHPELKRVYMVGDNPASDIAGANSYKSPRGTDWVSVLVRTGVFREGDSDGGAKAVVDNVEEAVRWAIEEERDLKA